MKLYDVAKDYNWDYGPIIQLPHDMIIQMKLDDDEYYMVVWDNDEGLQP